MPIPLLALGTDPIRLGGVGTDPIQLVGTDPIQLVGTDPALWTFQIEALNADSRPCDILFLGDSITEGFFSNTVANMWTSQVRDGLRSAYPSGVTGAYGRIAALNSVGSPPEADGYAVKVGGASNTQVYGISRRGVSMTASGHGVDYTFTGTGFDLIWPRLTGTSAFTYAIDGGAPVTVNSSGASVESGHSTRVTGLSAGLHTVAVRWSAGTSVTEGLMAYNGDESKGVRTWNAGRSGEQLSERATASATWRRSMAMVAPALVVITYGVNDYRDNTQTPTLFKGYLETLIAQVRAEVDSPSFLLIACYEPDHGGIPAWPWADYCTAISDVAAADPDCTFLDMRPTFGPRAGRGTTLVYSDQIHLQPAGATAWAGVVLAELAA